MSEPIEDIIPDPFHDLVIDSEEEPEEPDPEAEAGDYLDSLERDSIDPDHAYDMAVNDELGVW